MSGEDASRSSVTVAALVNDLMIVEDADRRTARAQRRDEIADLRLKSRRTQGVIRLADAFAKIGGGSLLTATLLLLVNGQVTIPVVATALSALLVFVGSTISLVILDRQIAGLDHVAEIIEAALKETER